jgi:hypothetical protein
MYVLYQMCVATVHDECRKREKRMAKKVVKRQPWTKEDIRTLKTLAREKKKTTTIARMLSVRPGRY